MASIFELPFATSTKDGQIALNIFWKTVQNVLTQVCVPFAGMDASDPKYGRAFLVVQLMVMMHIEKRGNYVSGLQASKIFSEKPYLAIVMHPIYVTQYVEQNFFHCAVLVMAGDVFRSDQIDVVAALQPLADRTVIHRSTYDFRVIRDIVKVHFDRMKLK